VFVAGLEFFLLGSPRIYCEDLPVELDARKNLALLAYLGITRECHNREALVTLLWPESEPGRARAILRRNLSVLKKALSNDYLLVDRETIGLNLEKNIWLDVDQFHHLLASWKEHGHSQDEICPECLPSLAEAVGLYKGDFLEGFSLRDSPNFDDWQFFQTQGLRQELATGLERLVRGYSPLGRFKTAIPHAQRWVALDPMHEPAQRYLMRLYAWSGQHAAALRQYEDCHRILQEELGVPPEDETTQLYEVIKAKEVPPPPEDRLVTSVQPTVLNNRYRLDEELGRGGQGVVYRAYDNLLDRDVAVKVMSVANLDSEGRARLLREAQLVARLNHPNIIDLFDAGEADGSSFIVMERVEGKSLAESKPNSLDEILAITRQICRALEYAHANGIVHRDLKPGNVILTPDGTVKLTDFGLACPVASRITRNGIIFGTVAYLAPELALGQPFDGRADLYALGAMLYELTTGSLPFTADDPMAVISQHLHIPIILPRARKADIPPALDGLIARLLSKNPEDRPTSAIEVLQILDAPNILDRGAAPAEELSVLKRIGRGRLVGREVELGEARGLWSLVIAGQGQMLLISGEPGIGKTRLVRELSTQVQVLGGRVLAGACYAEGSVPYAPFAQILRGALEGGVGDVLDLPHFVLAGVLTLAPDLRLDYREVEPEPTLNDARAEQRRLFENLTTCFAALSHRAPLLLILEDIHWADSATLILLRHLARHAQGRRIMIVATYRDVEPESAPALYETLLDLHRERLALHLRLPRLNRQQTREMLEVLFYEEITADFLEGIYQETEGNPFFIEEVCRALVDSGQLYFAEGRWHRPGMEELGIPRSVQVAIQSRVRVLPPYAQETLRLAAVLGREFDFETLASAVAGLPGSEQVQDEGRLIEALESAEQAQLIDHVRAEGGGTFAFVHALIPATLVESTRTRQRQQLHHCAAAAIEAWYPDDFEALAHHYNQAGEIEKAADYLLRAGDRARTLYAHQEAISNYRQALECLKKVGDTEQVARTLMKLGLTYHNAFDFKAARQAYQEGFVYWQLMADEKRTAPGFPPRASHALRVTAFEPRTLGLGLSMDFPSHVVLDQLFSGLVEVSPEMGLVPDMARSWEVFEGGRNYVFHLRNDARWSDGVPVTAQDFEYAWKRLLAPADRRWHVFLLDVKHARDYHQGLLSDPQLLGVRALDDFTLAVELEGPTSYFPYLTAFLAGYPMPRHVVEVHGDAWAELDNIVTNGPFRLVSWKPGESLVLERNPTYHGRFTGNLERVECAFLSGQPAKFLERYEENNLDICGGLPLAVFAGARQRFAGEYLSGPWMCTDFLGFDVSRPPFDDPRVRRAFGLATDRETLADVILRGYAFPGTGGFLPPGMPGHSPGIGLPYDPEAARSLLAEAGYPRGRGFPAIDCLARDDPGHDLACKYLQAHWFENLGVEITWTKIEWASFYELMLEATPQLWMVGWYADYPDPDDVLRVQWWLGFGGWQNEVYTQMVEGARRVMDQGERMRMYQQADKILIEEAPVLPLSYGCFHMLVKPWVRNLFTSPLKWWSWKDVIIEDH
jgi:ABC-type oligopeptide transport system substrate-binding subunit/DNA-binding SARP family transcriptional activator/predicted Ser/Thr protein kinase